MNRAAILLLFLALRLAAPAQTRVEDIFGRSLNQHRITLVDWEGYLANPLIKVYALAPTNAALPGSATLTANGSRLYFETPSCASTELSKANIPVPTAKPRVKAFVCIPELPTFDAIIIQAPDPHLVKTK